MPNNALPALSPAETEVLQLVWRLGSRDGPGHLRCFAQTAVRDVRDGANIAASP